MGEIFDLTPGKANNENDTLAARAAEQLGTAATMMHDQERPRQDENPRRPRGRRNRSRRSGTNTRDTGWGTPAGETQRRPLGKPGAPVR